MATYRRVSLDRLFNRVNATAARDGTYAFVVIAGCEGEMAVRLYRRLRNYNPVPARYGDCDDGWHTRNVPIERVIGQAFGILDRALNRLAARRDPQGMVRR